MTQNIFFDGEDEVGRVRPVSSHPVQVLGKDDDLPEIVPVTSQSELRQAMDSLDDDSFSKDTKMSKIDYNTILRIELIENVIPLESIISIGALPLETEVIPIKIKRLHVSRDGIGREQKTRIAQGLNEANLARRSVMDRVRGLFGGNRGQGGI